MSGVPCYQLPVYTVSGTHLGRVVDVEVEPERQLVVGYHVAPSIPLANLWHKHLVISKDQVVSISTERMVVQDASGRVVPESPTARLAVDAS